MNPMVPLEGPCLMCQDISVLKTILSYYFSILNLFHLYVFFLSFYPFAYILWLLVQCFRRIPECVNQWVFVPVNHSKDKARFCDVVSMVNWFLLSERYWSKPS